MLSHISRKISGIMSACLAVLLIVGFAHAQIVLDFEDSSLDDWEVVDEPEANLGDVGPGAWEIRDSEFGLDGKALYQGSNIWGSAGDTCLMGTFLIYKGEQFTNFTIDVDVVANDNDGMGLVWAYEDTNKHYRAIMINDGWPAGAVDGVDGPFMKIAKRISNEEPWYEMLDVVKEDYVPYTEGELIHWTLEVNNGSFTFTRDDGLSVSAEDDEYSGGYVGIQLYAQQLELDNFTITPSGTTAVDPMNKMATAWGSIKDAR